MWAKHDYVFIVIKSLTFMFDVPCVQSTCIFYTTDNYLHVPTYQLQNNNNNKKPKQIEYSKK